MRSWASAGGVKAWASALPFGLIFLFQVFRRTSITLSRGCSRRNSPSSVSRSLIRLLEHDLSRGDLEEVEPHGKDQQGPEPMAMVRPVAVLPQEAQDPLPVEEPAFPHRARLEHVRGQVSELPLEQPLEGHREPQLLPLQDLLRNPPGKRLPQDVLPEIAPA